MSGADPYLLNYEQALAVMRCWLPDAMLPVNASALAGRRQNGWGSPTIEDRSGKGPFTWRYLEGPLVAWCIDQHPSTLRATLNALRARIEEEGKA